MVANAVAALSEIAEASPHLQVMDMNSSTINKLLTALNECTEWGQVFILDCLSSYTPKDDREAQSTCERVTPRLAHANAAVVLSAVKVEELSDLGCFHPHSKFVFLSVLSILSLLPLFPSSFRVLFAFLCLLSIIIYTEYVEIR